VSRNERVHFTGCLLKKVAGRISIKPPGDPEWLFLLLIERTLRHTNNHQIQADINRVYIAGLYG